MLVTTYNKVKKIKILPFGSAAFFGFLVAGFSLAGFDFAAGGAGAAAGGLLSESDMVTALDAENTKHIYGYVCLVHISGLTHFSKPRFWLFQSVQGCLRLQIFTKPIKFGHYIQNRFNQSF